MPILSRSFGRPKGLSLVALLGSLLIGAISCSTGPKFPPSSQGEPSGTAAEPGPVTSEQNLETIAILGTNDIHGALTPMDLMTRETPPEIPGAQGSSASAAPVPYQAGGLTYLATYVKILREDMGDRLIWLDAGDEYQGTIESNLNRGRAMVAALGSLGLTAAAVGNHEFDFGAEAPDLQDPLSALKHRMKEASFPYLAANIYEASSNRLARFPNVLPSTLVTAGKVKVGIIGLSTVDTPRTTRPENVVSLRFGDLKAATLREARSLRARGAEVILITAHSGLFCETGHAPTSHVLRKPSDPQGSCGTRPSDEMAQLLRALPPGTVDAVVSGHTHSIVHHWVNGVPVIQGGSSGRYFNIIYLTYDLAAKKLIPDATRIEGPVPVCPKVFQNQGDCNGDRPPPKMALGEPTTNAPNHGRGALVTPLFHRERITEDGPTAALLAPDFAAADKTKNEVFGKSARPIEHFRSQESPLGDLVADALRVEGHADVALANSGGIRAPIEPGPITYGEIFRVSPFDNQVVVLTLSGKELRLVLQVAESGSRGFPPVSGLTLKLIHPDSDAPSSDLDGDKKIEPWEINRLLEVRMDDGGLLDDRKQYRLATIDYLVGGGDDFGWVMKQIPFEHRQPKDELVRDALAHYLKDLSARQGLINSVEHPALDPSHPRMIFEKVKLKEPDGKAKHHRRRRKRRA